MPYVVCINRPGCLPEADPTAVETIDEAREVAQDAVRMSSQDAPDGEGYGSSFEQAYTLPETGGVIGPMPDGYVIDVQRVEWSALPMFDTHRPDVYRSNRAAVIDAYNGA